MPYDLAIDVNGKLIRIQVKSAWFYREAYKVDTRMTNYKSEISLVETTKRQRKPKSAEYRENWKLLIG